MAYSQSKFVANYTWFISYNYLICNIHWESKWNRTKSVSLKTIYKSFNFLSLLQAIYHRLGDILARLQKWSEAERFHQAALKVEPDHVATHVSYGTMLARNVCG